MRKRVFEPSAGMCTIHLNKLHTIYELMRKITNNLWSRKTIPWTRSFFFYYYHTIPHLNKCGWTEAWHRPSSSSLLAISANLHLMLRLTNAVLHYHFLLLWFSSLLCGKATKPHSLKTGILNLSPLWAVWGSAHCERCLIPSQETQRMQSEGCTDGKRSSSTNSTSHPSGKVPAFLFVSRVRAEMEIR